MSLLATLMVMTLLAGLIGWSSHRTIVLVYDEAVQLLAASGKAAPPNPFDLKPTLSLLSNMAIYIPAIGALLALVLGHLSLADDQMDGVGRLIFSRPVSRTRYLVGKMVGAAIVLAAILVASLIVSGASVLLVNGIMPSATDVWRLTLFYGLSWLYLMVFALIGMVAVLATRRRSLALLYAIAIWLVLTFAVPQVTSGLRPTASLNPVMDPVSTSQPFFQFTARLRPWSVSEQYKEASAQILGTVPAESVRDTMRRVIPIAVLLTLLALAAATRIRRHDFSRSAVDE